MRSPSTTLQLRCIPGILLAVGMATATPRAIAAPQFAAPFLSFDTASRPSSAAIGDLNGDGIADMVTGNNSTIGTVSVFLGTADGSFGTRTDLAGFTAASVAIGDLNGDSRPDLVASGNQLSIWLGN